MNSTLAQIVELEADKLLTAAKAKDPLSGEQIESLEMLCKCARALRVDMPKAAEAAESDVEADLGLVDRVP